WTAKTTNFDRRTSAHSKAGRVHQVQHSSGSIDSGCDITTQRKNVAGKCRFFSKSRERRGFAGEWWPPDISSSHNHEAIMTIAS
ncbi:hypothetical protein, partial [Pseudomonas aeruginosa]|uniref:hypothetical protein n=1 Tax=Pseudomonas aeruginosa TaxID=287 RepID=UPI001ABD0409